MEALIALRSFAALSTSITILPSEERTDLAPSKTAIQYADVDPSPHFEPIGGLVTMRSTDPDSCCASVRASTC